MRLARIDAAQKDYGSAHLSFPHRVRPALMNFRHEEIRHRDLDATFPGEPGADRLGRRWIAVPGYVAGDASTGYGVIVCADLYGRLLRIVVVLQSDLIAARKQDHQETASKRA